MNHKLWFCFRLFASLSTFKGVVVIIFPVILILCQIVMCRGINLKLSEIKNETFLITKVFPKKIYWSNLWSFWEVLQNHFFLQSGASFFKFRDRQNKDKSWNFFLIRYFFEKCFSRFLTVFRVAFAGSDGKLTES